MSEKIPAGKYEIPDPYVGRVFGNILDQYDNPQYVITLSVPPPEESGETSDTDTNNSAPPPVAAESDAAFAEFSDSTDARADQPSATVTTVSAKRSKVVIAQTGVTATQIDDLEIQSAQTSGFAGVKEIKFTIHQPGGANLFDQIQYARKYMGYSDEQLKTGAQHRLLLEIEFKGYTADSNDSESGGAPSNIAGPFSMYLTVTNVAVRVDSTGSYYDFTCVLANDLGLADHFFKVQRNITSKGKTITEHVAGFEAEVNKYLENSSTNYTRPDKIKIDLSELINKASDRPGVGGADTTLTIKDDAVITSSTGTAEVSNRSMNDESLAETAEQREQLARQNPKTEGSVDPVAAGGNDSIDITEGTTISDYIGTLLSMNTEFKNKMSRKAQIDNAEDDTVNVDQTFVVWYGVKCHVKNLSWDARRKDYTKLITYTPYLYETARGDIVLTNNEYSHLEKRDDDAVRISTKRLQDIVSRGNLRKAYYYYFTGRNDQIIDLEIKMDQAAVLLMPPRGGYTGDISLTSAQNLIAQAPANKDMTLRSVLDKARRLADGRLFKDALSQLSETASDLAEFANGIGTSVEDLKSAIADRTGQSAQALVTALDTQTLRNAARALDAPFRSSDLTDTPTENSTITSVGFGPYVPEVSGQIYASDFVTPNDALSIEELESAGFIQADPNVSSNNFSPIVNAEVNNKFNRATYDLSSPSNMLFGYVYRQHQNVQFMMVIDMTIRGDPWYLGADSNTGRTDLYANSDSTGESAAWNANQNYFILQVRSPTAYDFRVDDEDSNSGYWPSSMSNSFSGVYSMMTVKNIFSRGIYTTEINAVKEETIPLHLIRPLRPGEAPLDFSDVNASNEEAIRLGIGFSSSIAPVTDQTGAASGTISTVDVDLGSNSEAARSQASAFLGSEISPADWQILVRATAAESGGNALEDANVMAVILNRVKSPGFPNTIQGVLTASGQFEAVTGTPDRTRNFRQPNSQRLARVTSNVAANLPTANKTWLNFTSTNPEAYTSDRGRAFLKSGLETPGRVIYGGTVFFTAR